MSKRTALRPHPSAHPWPTDRWPEGDLGSNVDGRRIDEAFDRVFEQPWPESYGVTQAVVAIHRGTLVRERYAPDHTRDSTFISWSMAKSILQCAIGTLVRDGKLDVFEPADVPEWRGAGDSRSALTVDQLLRMSSGLRFIEDYVDEHGSDCIRMLFGPGQQDVAGYAASLPLDHAPDTVWNYSSGTSNIIAAIAGRAIGGGAPGTRAYLERELLHPIGMRSATPRFDAAGTFIGSSYLFASARDFARFGLFYLRDGVWDGKRILPEGWVDHARTTTPGSAGEYGAHWWLRLVGEDSFHCSGFQGQYTLCVPSRDLVVVRLGVSTPEHREHVRLWLAEFVALFD